MILPNIAHAEGSEDLLLDQLIGSGVKRGESGTAEAVEDTAPAAAAPVENPADGSGGHTCAILTLKSIPLVGIQAPLASDCRERLGRPDLPETPLPSRTPYRAALTTSKPSNGKCGCACTKSSTRAKRGCSGPGNAPDLTSSGVASVRR